MRQNMAFTEQQGLFGRALDWLRQRLARGEEMAGFSQSDLQYMASDLGVTQADLVDVLPRRADNSLLMDQMIEARGLDPQAVRAAFATLVRDMELVCTRCQSTGRCHRDLMAGIADENCHEYCENAETIDDMLAVSKTV